MDSLALNDLIELVKQKDEQAFQELYRRFYKKTYYAALKISGNQADAKDIAQETFFQVYKSIASLQDNALFVQWLNRIIASKASDLFRKNKTTSLPEDHVVFQLKEEEHTDFIPEANMRVSSDRELLEHFVSSLDDRYRTVVVLRYFSQMSVQEISQALHVPDGTVKTRLKRARAILKTMIDQYEKEGNNPLNFKSADLAVIITGYFMSEFAAMQMDVSDSSMVVQSKKIILHQNASTILFTCLMVILTFAIAAVYCDFQKQDPSGIATTNANLETNKNKFGPVMYAGQQYDNPEDAYYALTLFVHCDVEMSEKTQAEMKAIVPLYNELKRYQGVYWELLKFREWDRKFEQFMNL